jgi:peptidoglycan hydrolase-like protein with peptidoglycan-binding domain
VQALFSKRVLVSLAVAAVVTGTTAVVGALVRDDASGAASAHPVERTAPSSTTTSTSTTTTTAPPPPPDAHALVQPGPATLPPPPGGSVGSGSSGPEVQAYEQRLSDLRFDPGPVDGVYDGATVYAVQALQKINGVPPTGRLTGNDVFALSYFQYPTPLAASDAEPNRTEIDITKQVLTLYENYQVELISTTSTGSGEHYCYVPRGGTSTVCEDAVTPAGKFAFYEYRAGWDPSPLGRLYNPFYFNRGIAVHGLEEVPPYPASHGCARIPMHVAEYFHTLVTNGEPVYVFGEQSAVLPAGSASPPPAPTPTTAAPATTAPPAITVSPPPPPDTTPPPPVEITPPPPEETTAPVL